MVQILNLNTYIHEKKRKQKQKTKNKNKNKNKNKQKKKKHIKHFFITYIDFPRKCDPLIIYTSIGSV